MIKLLRKLYNNFLRKKRELYIEDLIAKGLKIGKNSIPVADFFFDPSHCFLIEIGDNVTFAPNVRLIAHDASSKFLTGYTRIAKIRIGDNCFIGDSVIILPGVSIGANCVIGTGSIVTRSIPDNSVAVGSPARVIKPIDALKNELNARQNITQTFDKNFQIQNMTAERKKQLLDCLDAKGEAYLA